MDEIYATKIVKSEFQAGQFQAGLYQCITRGLGNTIPRPLVIHELGRCAMMCYVMCA